MVNLTDKTYFGRFKLAEEVEDNIKNLSKEIVYKARSIGVDLLAVSAVETIQNSIEAMIFKELVYPVEIAKFFFPGQGYDKLELFIDKTVKQEVYAPHISLNVTPKMIANRQLNIAYHGIHSAILGKNNKKAKEMKKIWEFESY